MESFGTLLRKFRQSCKDLKHPAKLLSQEKFGELLGEELGSGFSGAAISDWERGVSKIHADHRLILTSIIKILKQYEGITELKEANNFLNAGNYRSLNQEECNSLFPEISKFSTISKDSKKPLELFLPVGIPDEEYYFLPNREQQFSKLLQLLENKDGPQLITIDGLGGIGKTSMAIELVRRSITKGIFEGVLGETAKQDLLIDSEIISLHSPILTYESLLDSIIRQLQLWHLFNLDIKSKEVGINQVLYNKQYLVFIDNLETIENINLLVSQVRNILGSSRAVFTSRVKIHFDFAYSFTLEGLNVEDSVLFMQTIGDRMDISQIKNASKKELEEMHQLTGGLPLAMKLAVAQARYLEVSYILKRMQKIDNNLYIFIFKQSWEQLSELAKSILIYIGKTVIDTVSIQELVDLELTVNENELIKSLDELILNSLLNVSHSDKQIRYSIHQLTRQFIMKDLPNIWQEQGLL